MSYFITWSYATSLQNKIEKSYWITNFTFQLLRFILYVLVATKIVFFKFSSFKIKIALTIKLLC